jgi:hypothetical protein
VELHLHALRCGHSGLGTCLQPILLPGSPGLTLTHIAGQLWSRCEELDCGYSCMPLVEDPLCDCADSCLSVCLFWPFALQFVCMHVSSRISVIIIIIIIQFQFINVPSQQPEGQLHKQHNTQTQITMDKEQDKINKHNK